MVPHLVRAIPGCEKSESSGRLHDSSLTSYSSTTLLINSCRVGPTRELRACSGRVWRWKTITLPASPAARFAYPAARRRLTPTAHPCRGPAHPYLHPSAPHTFPLGLPLKPTSFPLAGKTPASTPSRDLPREPYIPENLHPGERVLPLSVRGLLTYLREAFSSPFSSVPNPFLPMRW